MHIFANSALGEDSRRVYVLAAIDGLSNAEIAAKTGLGEAAVRRMKSRVSKLVAAMESRFVE